MAHVSDLIAEDIDQYLIEHENKTLLRFITCGSVDDGKSTLIGRMLYESKMVFEDHLTALKSDSKKTGTQGDEIDFSLLVDGLAAEREQGITIDVAYRFFSTQKRKFIVADTPGHEQYTRNMATGASTADLAILLVDARNGVLEQTKRHSFIVSMLGVKTVLVAINKMDLVDYSQEAFETIKDDYSKLVDEASLVSNFVVIPISALKGDNLIKPSENLPWYDGPCLMNFLENVEIDTKQDSGSFRMPVQWVNRPDSEFRGFSGTVSGGNVNVGDEVRIVPSGKVTRIKSIVTYDGNLQSAVPHQSITLTLEDEIDISRGDVVCDAKAPSSCSDQFQCQILWMSENQMMPGRQYIIKTGSMSTLMVPSKPKHKIDVNTLTLSPAKTLKLNEIGICNISLSRALPYD